MNNRKNRNTSGMLSLRCFYLENTIVRKSIPLRTQIITVFVSFVKAGIRLSDVVGNCFPITDTSTLLQITLIIKSKYVTICRRFSTA